MIETYVSAKEDIKLAKVGNLNDALWVDVVDPTDEEMALVSQVLCISHDDMIDALDPEERPRYEVEEDYFLLMLRVPSPAAAKKGIYSTAPVGFFVRKGHLITVHHGSVSVVEFFRDRRRKWLFESPYQILVATLGSINRSFSVFVKEVQLKLSEFRSTILKSMKTESVDEAFELSNDLIFLSSSVNGNVIALDHLLRDKRAEFPEELVDRLEDIVIDTRQNYETVTMYRELLSSTLDAYTSAISNNLNLVLKIVASLSLIIMLPTLIASLYGMNIGLPFRDPMEETIVFWIVLLFSFLWSGFLWYLLRKKEWL